MHVTFLLFPAAAASFIHAAGSVRFSRFLMRRSLFYVLLFVFSMCGCTSAGTSLDESKSPIGDFRVVTPNVLWHGDRPDKVDAAWLIEHGVKTVVSLEFILNDLYAFHDAVIKDAGTYKVGYFRMHDFEPVNIVMPWIVDDEVARFIAIMIREPKPVYFHCLLGGNRSGVMIAAYRVVVEGVSFDKALEEMDRPTGLWVRLWLYADRHYIRGLLLERREELERKIREWIPKLKMDARITCMKGKCTISEGGE